MQPEAACSARASSGRLDALQVPACLLDILARQVLAERAGADCAEGLPTSTAIGFAAGRPAGRPDRDAVILLPLGGTGWALGRGSGSCWVIADAGARAAGALRS
jgi:hypothetical protein